MLTSLVGSASADYFVSIGAAWCPGCLHVKARFKQLGIPLSYYDVDEEPECVKWLEGTSIPQTFRMSDDRKILKRSKKAMSIEEIKEFTK